MGLGISRTDEQARLVTTDLSEIKAHLQSLENAIIETNRRLDQAQTGLGMMRSRQGTLEVQFQSLMFDIVDRMARPKTEPAGIAPVDLAAVSSSLNSLTLEPEA